MEKGSDIFGPSNIEKNIGQSLPQIICKLFQGTKISALINKLINKYVVIVIDNFANIDTVSVGLCSITKQVIYS